MIVLLILEGLRGKREAMLAPLLALIVIAGMPFLPLTRFGVNALRASKIESIARGVSDFDSRCYNEDIDAVHGDRSVSERWKLVASAFERFKAHPFRGLGAGNSKELISGITSERTYIHNFWLEIMFESGIVMFFIILVWSMVILRRLFTISHLTTSWVENRMAVASIASLIGCIPAALAAETLVAQSSFWLLIGISVGLIFGSRLVGPAGSGPSLGSSE
jgi:O-antigen ligase